MECRQRTSARLEIAAPFEAGRAFMVPDSQIEKTPQLLTGDRRKDR